LAKLYADGCRKLAHVGWCYVSNGQSWWSTCPPGTRTESV
jgi:hypothetical protein